MQIVIGGDLVPTQSNIRDFKTGDISGLVGAECRALLKDSDVNIFNLECPLCSHSQPIEKCGPNMMAPAETVKGNSRAAGYHCGAGIANDIFLVSGSAFSSFNSSCLYICTKIVYNTYLCKVNRLSRILSS